MGNEPDYITEIEQKIMQLTPEECELVSLFVDALINDDQPMIDLLWAIARGEVERARE